MPNLVARESDRPRSSTSAGVVIAALTLLLCATASAAAPDRCDADAGCSKLADQAARAAAQTEYDQALELYERAYTLSHEPRLLINIGRCEFRLGRARKALASFVALQIALPDAEPELTERLQVFMAEARLALDADGADGSRPLPEAPPTASGSATGAATPDAGTAKPEVVLPPDRCLADRACQQLSDQAAQFAAQTYYDRALGLYLRAHQRSQEPRLLVNVGRCYYRTGRARRALETFYEFKRTTPAVEPEVRERVDTFVSEARVSLMRDQSAQYSDVEPSPAGMEQASTATSRGGSGKVLGRPAWRVGAGLGLTAVGALMIGLGAGALSAHDSCVSSSALLPGACATMVRPDGQRSTLLYDGLTPGVSLLVVGGVVAIGGVVLIALPSREKQTAWRAAPATHGMTLAR